MKRGALLVVALLAGAARADDASWDGRYQKVSGGGDEKCPDAVTVVVSGGAFSFAWNVRLGDHVFRVGTIAGTVRPSGLAVLQVTVTSPLPGDAQAALEEAGDTAAMLQTVASEMTMRFGAGDGRSFELDSGMCYGTWSGDAGKPAAKPTKTTAVKPPPPLAPGAPAWDGHYRQVESAGDDWWCPSSDALGDVVVKKGRFALPWRVAGVDGNGHDWGAVKLGEIDGSIAASGATKLRPWFAVTELPPELTTGRDAKEATLARVKAHVPTMSFSTASRGRHARLVFGKSCSYEFAVGESATASKRPRGGDSASSKSEGSKTTTSKSEGSKSPTSKTEHTASSTPAPRSPSPPRPPAPKKGKTNGAACDVGSECASDHCEFGKCSSNDSGHKQLGNGMACDYSSDCASGRCEFGKCSSGDSGHKQLGTGMACDFSSDCASGRCTFDKCE